MTTFAENVQKVWDPLPVQEWANNCPAFEMLYGGSKGGGKTKFLVASPLRILAAANMKWEATGQQQRTVRNMVFRKNLEDLRDFIAKTWELYPRIDAGAAWHEKEKFWRFSSGATVEMNHLDDPRSHERFNGQEFASLLIDEVQFVPKEAYTYLLAQVRSKDPDIDRLTMVRCTANPGGPHGDWVRTWFHIDDCPDGGRIYEHEVELNDGTKRTVKRAFIRAWLRDNPHLGPQYEANLRASMTSDEVRMYLDGDFDCVAGAFFSTLLRTVHFQRSFPIPGDWDMIHSTDWGSSSPSSTLIGARNGDNVMYVIDELHAPGITGSHYGGLLEDMWRRQKWSSARRFSVDDFWGVIDTQAMHEINGSATPASGIQEKGFRLFPADKLPGERLDGINQMKERLLMDRHGKPRVVIFEDRCPHLVRAIKAIQSQAPIDPNDYEKRSPHSHSIDSWRFMCMKWLMDPEDKTHPLDAEAARWMALSRNQRQSAPNAGGFSSGYDG